MQIKEIEMRKQVDFVFRQLEYSAVDATKTSAKWSEYIRETYLANGYEVLNTEIAKAEANSVFLGITLVKYEDVPDKAAKEK